jgi:hypothetical protein
MSEKDTSSNSKFSAEEPGLGYLYQMFYGLLLMLDPDINAGTQIIYEKLDDIALIYDENTDLFQTKFHANSPPNLTDYSPELWKTIRIWAEGIKNGTFNIDKTLFSLISTATSSLESLPYYLRPENNTEENYEKILESINSVMETSTNKTNQPGFEAFSQLTDDEKKKLISKIRVFDGQINIENVTKGIKGRLRLVILDHLITSFYERLTGWYMSQVILQLLGKREGILFEEIQSKNFEIIDTLKSDNLPADFPDPLEFTEEEYQNHSKRVFVKQLKLIRINPKGIKNAMSDYYRAYNQRSRWERENLINPQEPFDFDKRLHDDWKRKFDIMAGDCDPDNEDERVTIGKRFYEQFYIYTIPQVPIRTRFNQAYLVTGSCHLLADGKKIGWHPDYEKNLM